MGNQSTYRQTARQAWINKFGEGSICLTAYYLWSVGGQRVGQRRAAFQLWRDSDWLYVYAEAAPLGGRWHQVRLSVQVDDVGLARWRPYIPDLERVPGLRTHLEARNVFYDIHDTNWLLLARVVCAVMGHDVRWGKQLPWRERRVVHHRFGQTDDDRDCALQVMSESEHEWGHSKGLLREYADPATSRLLGLEVHPDDCWPTSLSYLIGLDNQDTVAHPYNKLVHEFDASASENNPNVEQFPLLLDGKIYDELSHPEVPTITPDPSLQLFEEIKPGPPLPPHLLESTKVQYRTVWGKVCAQLAHARENLRSVSFKPPNRLKEPPKLNERTGRSLPDILALLTQLRPELPDPIAHRQALAEFEAASFNYDRVLAEMEAIDRLDRKQERWKTPAEIARERASHAYSHLVPSIESARESGLTFREIAKQLTEQGHRTREGREFHPQTVKRLFDRAARSSRLRDSM